MLDPEKPKEKWILAKVIGSLVLLAALLVLGLFPGIQKFILIPYWWGDNDNLLLGIVLALMVVVWMRNSTVVRVFNSRHSVAVFTLFGLGIWLIRGLGPIWSAIGKAIADAYHKQLLSMNTGQGIAMLVGGSIFFLGVVACGVRWLLEFIKSRKGG